MIRENFAYSTIFTFVLTFLMALALSSIYKATAQQVALNQQAELARATLQALGLPLTDDPVAAFAKQFGKTPDQYHGLEQTELNGQQVKVYQFNGKGLWGRIRGILVVNDQVSKIIGLSIVEQNETPGLGGRITEPEFQDQFRGEKIGEKIALARAAGDSYSTDRSNSSFDAISGATLTSTFFATIVNDAIRTLRNS